MLQFMLQTATSVLFVFQWFTRINGKSARHGRNIDRRICLQTLPCPPSVLRRQSRARQQSQQLRARFRMDVAARQAMGKQRELYADHPARDIRLEGNVWPGQFFSPLATNGCEAKIGICI
jgi:hypothetical protein